MRANTAHDQIFGPAACAQQKGEMMMVRSQRIGVRWVPPTTAAESQDRLPVAQFGKPRGAGYDPAVDPAPAAFLESRELQSRADASCLGTGS